jgi:hypothetical protein
MNRIEYRSSAGFLAAAVGFAPIGLAAAIPRQSVRYDIGVAILACPAKADA